MSASDFMISNMPLTAISGCDIRINYNNLCKIITAANQAVGPLALFYTDTQGTSWTPSVLPLIPGDLNHRHPSVDWTPGDLAWVVTVANRDDGIKLLRCYKSMNTAATTPASAFVDWQQDKTFSFDHKNVDTPKLCVCRSLSNFPGRIFIIWINDGSVFVTFKDWPPGSGTQSSWQTPPIQVSGPETTTAAGCDIKTNKVGGAHAFWHDTASRQLFVASWPAGFATGEFTSPSPVTSTPPSYATSPINIESCRDVPISISAGTYQTVNQAAANPTDPSSFVYVVWDDLSGDNGCDSPSSSPVTSPGCKIRIWFARGTSKITWTSDTIPTPIIDVTWEPPVKINDQLSMNDQFMPRLAVDETNGRLIVVYYDTVGDDTRTSTNVFMQTSEDNGMNWSDATPPVTSARTNEVTSDSWWQYGDYIGLSTCRNLHCCMDRSTATTDRILARTNLGSIIQISNRRLCLQNWRSDIDKCYDNI